MKKIILSAIIILLTSGMCACSYTAPHSGSAAESSASRSDKDTPPQLPDDVCFIVNIKIQSHTPVYKLHSEYYLDRKAVGGNEYGNTDQSKPFSDGETACFEIVKALFPGKNNIDGFGIALYVCPENGEETLIDAFVEWDAKKGGEYNFILSGNIEDGFTLSPASPDFDCRKTEWSELS